MDDVARSTTYPQPLNSLTIPVDAPLVESPAVMAPEIPAYLQETYYWCYLNPRNVKLLDREFVVRTILWQQQCGGTWLSHIA